MRIALRVVIGLLVFAFYGPLVWTCVRAFITPDGFGLHWFRELIQDPSFHKSVENSLWLAFSSSLLSVFLAFLAVIKFPIEKQSRNFDRIMALSLSLPEIILALALLSFFSALGWSLGFLTAWAAHATLTLAFAYGILSMQYLEIDRSILEAAQDLGATPLRVVFKIVIPQMKPALISSFWICFLLSLDDFLLSFFVTGSSFETLPLKLFSMMKVGLDQKVNALCFLILLFSSLILVGLYGVWHSRSRKQEFP